MNIFKRFANNTAKDTPQIEQSNVIAQRQSSSITESLLIPEPTRSLLWTTDEDTSKVENATSITIVTDGVNFHNKENGFYSEPSLIWTKLPIKANNELIQEAMYWPSYSSFSPEVRYQYLRWLGDITQPTNLSYVFLYFYGLERHLLIGEYDEAVDEIARLLKAHPKKSFVNYASQSLIVASLARDRLDIVDRVPSLLEEEIDEALALRIIKGTSMTPEDVISIANKVGFNNNRYIKLYPELFKEELQKHIDQFEKQFGSLMSTFKLEDFTQEETTVFANLSIPERIRLVKVPVILKDQRFSNGMNNLLQSAHNEIKAKISNGDIQRRSVSKSKQPQQLSNFAPVNGKEVDALIDKLRVDHSDILDLHFAIMTTITEHYRQRQVGDNYHKAVVSCMAQIKIQADAAKGFIHEYPNQPLPSHTGYNQLVIILEKEKKFKEALKYAKEAKANGWNGDWDKRVVKLQAKI